MSESQWTIVWSEGDDPNNDEINTDRYILLDTREKAVRYVDELIDAYEISDGREGAPPADILIFPPGTAVNAQSFHVS